MRRHLDKWNWRMNNTKLFAIWYQVTWRNRFFQIVLLLSIVCFLYFLYQNLQQNLASRGITSGFDFFYQRAGFNIIMHLIPYSEKSTYFAAFIVGLLNTILVSAIAIIMATMIGTVVGVARVSSNWLWRQIALGYVELIRNVPLLLQIFFWYFVVLRSAPYPQEAIRIFDTIFITNRGIYFPHPLPDTTTGTLLGGALLCGLLVLFFSLIRIAGINRVIRPVFWLGILLFFLGLGLSSWQHPVLGRFNYEQGIVLIPEFLALVIALSVYTSAFIAEIIRMGILSVNKGQTEAALSLGLSKRQTLRLVILPQALKVIIPPLTNQYLNLTKNSSLAAAVAYPDLVAVFAGTVLNLTGQAVEIIAVTMGVYLTVSLVISLSMNLYERKHHWGQT